MQKSPVSGRSASFYCRFQKKFFWGARGSKCFPLVSGQTYWKKKTSFVIIRTKDRSKGFAVVFFRYSVITTY